MHEPSAVQIVKITPLDESNNPRQTMILKAFLFLFEYANTIHHKTQWSRWRRWHHIRDVSVSLHLGFLLVSLGDHKSTHKNFHFYDWNSVDLFSSGWLIVIQISLRYLRTNAQVGESQLATVWFELSPRRNGKMQIAEKYTRSRETCGCVSFWRIKFRSL